jgi:hypothetical protein
MPNRDGTGPRWAQRPTPATQGDVTDDAARVAVDANTASRPGCRGQGGSGRGLGRGRDARGPGAGCGRRWWAD